MGLGLRFVNDLRTFSCDGNDSIIGLIGFKLFVLITSFNQPVIDDTVLEVVLLLEEEDDDDDINRLFPEHEDNDDDDCDDDENDNDDVA